jgi:ADP-heptose:LPS heptosyltransferase
MSPPARVALLRPGALGDALLAFPALAWLRRAWPETRLLFVARPDVLPLAEAAGLADETRAFDDPVWAALWREPSAASTAALRQALGSADAAVAWLRDADGTVEPALRAAGAARMVVAPGQPPEHTREHVALYLARSLAPLGLGVAPPDMVKDLVAAMPRLVPSGVAARAADAWWQIAGLARARVVALHPGSGGAAKCWPAERFAALAGRLIRAAYVPLVVEGPADEAAVARLLASPPAPDGEPAWSAAEWPPPVARGLSVAALASVLGHCAAYVGNDSGVSHLAALSGCPTLALFGPTHPWCWAPMGQPVDTPRAADGNMEAFSVDYVWVRLRRLLPG